MGCTSSAPKMIASHVNATETNSQFLEEIELINEPKRRKTVVNNGTQVLPLCDNNIEDKQLSSNKRPASEKPTRMDLTVDQESQTCDDIESCDDSSSSKQTEEKLTSLNEVVEKVVELYVSNNSLNSIENLQKEIEETHRNESQEEIFLVTETDKKDIQQNVQVENQLEELASPSQSESSRATRWEALADIAAELPPSLAVDPVTGQIYALSK